jgi:hypothetical protein
MDRHEWPRTALTIALHGGLYFSIIMDRYEDPQSVLTIALLKSLYLVLSWIVMEGPTLPLIYPCMEACNGLVLRTI